MTDIFKAKEWIITRNWHGDEFATPWEVVYQQFKARLQDDAVCRKQPSSEMTYEEYLEWKKNMVRG